VLQVKYMKKRKKVYTGRERSKEKKVQAKAKA
jgi:hypothetical protein